MTRNLFSERERALEYEFFHKVDERLLRQLRERIEFESKEQALSYATGITDEAVLAELLELGISSETIFALTLFPLVWVAWADGDVAEQERQAILDAAHALGHERDSASHRLIEAWLDHKPDEKLLQAWKDYVHECCKSLRPETTQSVKRDVVNRTRQIAEAAGGILGFHKISSAESEIIEQIAQAFEGE